METKMLKTLLIILATTMFATTARLGEASDPMLQHQTPRDRGGAPVPNAKEQSRRRARFLQVQSGIKNSYLLTSKDIDAEVMAGMKEAQLEIDKALKESDVEIRKAMAEISKMYGTTSKANVELSQSIEQTVRAALKTARVATRASLLATRASLEKSAKQEAFGKHK